MGGTGYAGGFQGNVVISGSLYVQGTQIRGDAPPGRR